MLRGTVKHAITTHATKIFALILAFLLILTFLPEVAVCYKSEKNSSEVPPSTYNSSAIVNFTSNLFPLPPLPELEPKIYIQSIEHNASSVLGPYDTLNVTLKGLKGYNVSFDIEKIASGIKMVEESSGVYKGNYTVSTGDDSGTYNITGYLKSGSKTLSSKNTSDPITIDTTPPTISNVEVVNITNRSARINWTTDENSTSKVEYGNESGNLDKSVSNDTLVKEHSLKLLNLTSGTTYYFKISSEDEAGNIQTSKKYNFTTKPTILVVDDDDGASYGSEYKDALDANNYTYDYVTTKKDESPGVATLKKYDVAIWFTADDYNVIGEDDCVCPTERADLKDFLNNSGKLFITGQDIGCDVGGTSFYNDYLHASYQADDSGGSSIDGISNDSISDGFEGAKITGKSPDEIEEFDTYAEKTFYYHSTSKVASIKADNGISRVVYIACMYYEGNDPASNKSTIMGRIIKWLISPADTTPPSFDGLKYANDTIYKGTINLTWNPASDPSTPITYNIYISTTSGGQNFSSPNCTTQQTKKTVTRLTNNITYYFVVRAEDNFGNEENNTIEKNATPTGTKPIEKYAVIVGISDYKKINDLRYCDEDANDWYYFLTNSTQSSSSSEADFNYTLGETYEHIWVYGDDKSSYAQKDGVATEYNVKKALKSVVENATYPDVILFASSGHGSSSGGKSYLCMWDSDAGENGEDGNLYDDELSAILDDSVADRIFVSIDHCHSGHFCDELATMSNKDNVFVVTTCTIDGSGYDDSNSKNGMFTNWFLNKGLRNGESGNTTGDVTEQNMEDNIRWVKANYPKSGDDEPQYYDGDTSKLFYLND